MNTVGERYLGTVEMAETPYMTAKTSVWWDIESCQIPRGFDAYGIAQNIGSALEKMNYCGPISIYAYGDVSRIPPTIQHALYSTGIALNHVPAGVKDASDKKILVDMLLRAVDIPAPATFMLISGDIDFSNALQQLRYGFGQAPSAGGSPPTQSGSSQLVSNETTSPNNQYPYSSRPVPSPVRQPNPNPGPFPVRRPNADPSGSSGNRIPNQAQNNSPTAARQCFLRSSPGESLPNTLLMYVMSDFDQVQGRSANLSSQSKKQNSAREMVKVLTYFGMTLAAFAFWQSMDKVHVWIALHQDEKQERMEKEAEVKRVRAELLRKAREEDPLA
ncbi:hypothetical protein IGI04_028382 [Brassica rapa subsp. trilocularis]|uniref:NYN domain-containing protein n=1 Tax=Brassica rapa subsp. trilocularis TaxID=1813537 RepID=A0ABQ7L424_BRACM|nr:hypothetical protein IGI04_028382 [Brassica rapa subsp. trilocularis]